jgi:hypothetical protein
MLTVATTLITLAASGTALAARPSLPLPKPTRPVIGNDVSYPQCGKSLPTPSAFGIVGVNGGTADDFNPCLETELSWAENTPGTFTMPDVALYANTGNPADAVPQAADWPTTSNPFIDPFGMCTGANTVACSWEYGYQRAYADAARATSPMWWLDIETVNSWSQYPANNQADLEGMVYALTIAGSRVGVYSTPAWWTQILGTVPPMSKLYWLPEWLPGASTKQQALSTCTQKPFTFGAHITVAQYTTNNLDYDLPCPF